MTWEAERIERERRIARIAATLPTLSDDQLLGFEHCLTEIATERQGTLRLWSVRRPRQATQRSKRA